MAQRTFRVTVTDKDGRKREKVAQIGGVVGDGLEAEDLVRHFEKTGTFKDAQSVEVHEGPAHPVPLEQAIKGGTPKPLPRKPTYTVNKLNKAPVPASSPAPVTEGAAAPPVAEKTNSGDAIASPAVVSGVDNPLEAADTVKAPPAPVPTGGPPDVNAPDKMLPPNPNPPLPPAPVVKTK